MSDDAADVPKAESDPLLAENELPDRAMAELWELAKRAKTAIQSPPLDIEPERSGQLSPPHTPGRGRK